MRRATPALALTGCFQPVWPPAPGSGKLVSELRLCCSPACKPSRAARERNTRVHAAPEPPAGAHTGSETRTLLSGSAENTTTEKSHCHLQRGCKSAAARSFPRCTHFPHTLTFGLPQISSLIKKRISNTSVQKTLESGEHEDSAPRNAISKTKLPVCLCMGRTEEAGEVKGGKKKKSQKAKPRRQFCTGVQTRITHLPRAAASPRCKLHQANPLQALPPPAPSPERLSPAVLQLLPRTEV